MNAELRIFETAEGVIESAGERMVTLMLNSVEMQGECTIALSGGSTPKPLYQQLGSEYREIIPWEKIHLFWGDERFVSPDSAESNYRLVNETMLQNIPIPEENVHPFDTTLASATESAEDYEQALREYFPDDLPRIDIALMGMGSDGHTASLFPGTEALRERERWVTTSVAPDPPRERLTLTYPALNASGHVLFLVTGEHKAEALQKVHSGEADRDEYPSAGIRPEHGEVIWFVDRAAAARV